MYNQFMQKTPVSRFLERVYLKWINSIGEVRTQKEFSQFLGVEYSKFNRYYNGHRSDMDYVTALKICRAVKDYELMEILGFEIPEEDLIAVLPTDRAASLRAALTEIRERLAKFPGLSEAQASVIVDEIMLAHGWTVKDTALPSRSK